MLWQAESGFWFRMAGGYLSPSIPPSFAAFRAVQPSLTATTTRRDIVELALAKGVRWIIVDQLHPNPWRTLVPGTPTRLGGVLLYHLPTPVPRRAGCDRRRVG